MASLKSTFMAIFFLITVVSATITTSPPSKKCKYDHDCKQVKCSGPGRLFPVCGGGICNCFQNGGYEDRPCDPVHDSCLADYNSTCSIITSSCECIEIPHPNNKNNAKNDVLSNKMMEREGVVENRNDKCDIVSCKFECVFDPDLNAAFGKPAGCMCNPLPF